MQPAQQSPATRPSNDSTPWPSLTSCAELAEADTDLRRLTNAISRHFSIERVQAWWRCSYLADPDHFGLLTLGEWKAIRDISGRAIARTEAFEAEMAQLNPKAVA